MVGKNNTQLRKQKAAMQKPRYGLRKLTVGFASVLLGTMFVFTKGQLVQADETGNALPTVQTTSNAITSKDSGNSELTEATSTQAQPETKTAVTDEPSAINTSSQNVPATDTSVASSSPNSGTVSPATSADTTVNETSPVIESNAPIQPRVRTATPNVTASVASDGLTATDDNGRTLHISRSTLGNDGSNSGITVGLSGTINAGDVYIVKVPNYLFSLNDNAVMTAGALTGAGTVKRTSEKIDGINYNVYTFQFTNNFTISSQGLQIIINDGNNYTGQGRPSDVIKDGDAIRKIYWSHYNSNDTTTPIENPSLTYTTKIHTSLDNAQLIQTKPDPKTVNKLLPDVTYEFELDIRQATGIQDDQSYSSNKINSARNYGAQIVIPVPADFILDEAASRLASQLKDGDQTTITQVGGKGGNIVITVPKGYGAQGYEVQTGYKLVGKFEAERPETTSTLTAAGPITIQEQILTEDGLTTISKTLAPWQITMLGKDAIPDQGKLPLYSWGNNNSNLFSQTVATKITNYFSFTNQTSVEFKNSLHIVAEFPKELAITGFRTPQLNEVARRGTTAYTYTAYLTDGTVLTGTIKAGEAVTAPTGKLLQKVELIPDVWAVGAETNKYVNYYTNGNFGTNQYDSPESFVVYGTLAPAIDEADPLPADLRISTKFTVWSPEFGNGTAYTNTSNQRVQSVADLKSDAGATGSQTSNQYYSEDLNWKSYGSISVTNANSSSIGTKYIHEPIFYYVLPEHMNFPGTWKDIVLPNPGEKGVVEPKLTKFMYNGREVIKLDYTGTGFNFDVKAGNYVNGSNQMPIAIDPDAEAGSYGWQVYMFTRTGMVNTSKEVLNPEEDVKGYTQGITDSGASGKLYLLGSGAFTIKTPPIAYVPNTAQGNQDVKPVQIGTSDDKGSDQMAYFVRLANYSTDGIKQGYLVSNLPQSSDTSFTFHLTRAVEFEPHSTAFGMNDFEILYSYDTQTLPNQTQKGYLPSTVGFMTADQVDDWSKVKAVMIRFLRTIDSITAVGQFIFHGTDPNFINDANKTAYLDTALMGEGMTPFISTQAGIKITGESTVKARLHYVDENGQDRYIDVPALTKTYSDNQDTLKLADFDVANIPADLIPAHYQLVAGQTPTIIKTGKYSAGQAGFNQTVAYYFDGDTVQFELEHIIDKVTKTVTRTDKFEYDPSAPLYRQDGDNSIAAPVTKTYTVTQMTDEVTGEVTYLYQEQGTTTTGTEATFTIPGVTVPEKVGYLAGTATSEIATKGITFDIAAEFAKHPEDSIAFTNTVTYTALPQEFHYVVIDDTDSKIIIPDLKIATGVTDGAIDDENKTVYWDVFNRLNQGIDDGYDLSYVHYYDTDQGKFIDSDDGLGMPKTYSADPSKNIVTMHLIHSNRFTLETKTVTRTINFWDADQDRLINDANGRVTTTQYPQTVKQVVTLKRYAIYDMITKALVGYYKPSQVDVIFEGSGVVPKVGEKWIPYAEATEDTAGYEATDETSWQAVATYDLTKFGYEKATDSNDRALASIAAQDVDATTADTTVDVFYHEKWVSVTPDNPPTVGGKVDNNDENSPVYPANEYANHVQDYESTSTRTIHYRYAQGTSKNGVDVSGQPVAGLNDIHQTVKFYRQVEINLVTGELSVRNIWLPVSATTEDQNGTSTTITSGAVGDYASVPTPYYDPNKPTEYDFLKGYTPQEAIVKSIAAIQGVNAGDVYVVITSNTSLAQVSYIDQDTGNTLFTDGINGNSGDTINYTTQERLAQLAKAGYKLVSDGWTTNPEGLNKEYLESYDDSELIDTDAGKVPLKIKQIWKVYVGHKHVTVTAEAGKATTDQLTDGDGYTHNYPQGVDQKDLNTTVTRQISFIYKDGREAFAPVTQESHWTRTADIDLVKLAQGSDDAVHYSKWVHGTTDVTTPVYFDAYNLTANKHTLAGYTANTETVANERIAFDLAGKPKNGGDKVVIYTPKEQKTNITFVDKETGKVITPTYEITGHTDETITLKQDDGTFKTPSGTEIKVPAGWRLVTGQEIPTMITFTGDHTPDQRILIEHATVLVTPDDPKTTTDPLPDNPNLTYTTGLEAGDLNQTVTRTIIVYLPDGTTKQLVQTAKFQRSALVDEVTKHVTYNPWELVTGYRDSFASVGAPEIVGQLDGYTPTNAAPEMDNIQPLDKDTVFTIRYTANPQNAQIKLVDDDANGQILNQLTAIGKFAEQIVFTKNGQSLEQIIATLEAKGYIVNADATDNFAKGTTYQSDDQQNQFVLHFKHKQVTAHRTKTITEVIHYVFADATHSQAADDYQTEPGLTVIQDGVTDLVTKTTIWNSAWHQKVTLAAVDSPEIQGYTADQPEVAPVAVLITNDNFADPKLNTVERTVIYSPNKQSATVIYVDDDNNQLQIGDPQVINGQTDQKVATNIINPDPNKYVLVSGYPTEISFTADGTHDGKQIVVHLKHKLVDQKRTKTVTMTVTYNLPAGPQTVAKTLIFTQGGIKDMATGVVIWDQGWNDQASFATLNSPDIEGYTPEMDSVGGDTVVVSDATWDENLDKAYVVNYTPNPETVTVQHITTDGQPLHPSENLIGVYGGEYTAIAKDIPGYHLVSGPAQVNGTYQVDNHAVVFVYAPDEEQVVVHYQTADGHQLASSTVLTGTFGAAFTAQAIQIPGYHLQSAATSVSGQFKLVNDEIIFIYAPDNQPQMPEDDADKNNAPGTMADKKVALSDQQNPSPAQAESKTEQLARLPQTGAEETTSETVWGLLLIMLAGLLGIDLKNKKKKHD
ncbi:mucin-binding protein [Ligilactobacillus saerimneri]